jgi:hypothetical protein
MAQTEEIYLCGDFRHHLHAAPELIAHQVAAPWRGSEGLCKTRHFLTCVPLARHHTLLPYRYHAGEVLILDRRHILACLLLLLLLLRSTPALLISSSPHLQVFTSLDTFAQQCTAVCPMRCMLQCVVKQSRMVVETNKVRCCSAYNSIGRA